MAINLSSAAMVAELTKWKLSLAVAFSSVTGFLIFSAGTDSGLIAVAAGVFLLSSGASALNQYTEREIDSLMPRTAGRPLPSGRMSPHNAITVAVILLISGSTLLGFSGRMPFFLGLVNVLLYNVIYTGLKRRTTLAIVPGALVGAIPPVIGYTAAGGTVTDTVIMLFALFMFLWQMPHFWLLLVRYGSEYEKAGIKTLYSRMDGEEIKRLVFVWIIVSSVALWILAGIFMPMPAFAGVLLLILNILLILLFRKIISLPETEKRSRHAFILINSFSILVMIVLIAVFNI
ncbi:MAG: protoheme IX farnesyltransferase [Bacteroidales bacterium]